MSKIPFGSSSFKKWDNRAYYQAQVTRRPQVKSEALWSNWEFASNKIRISPNWFASFCYVYHPGQPCLGEAFSFWEFIFLLSRAQLLSTCLCLGRQISVNMQLSSIVILKLIYPRKRLSFYATPEQKRDKQKAERNTCLQWRVTEKGIEKNVT